MITKAVFFDLDGTVLDTEQDIYCCMNEALSKLGYEKKDHKTIKSAIGNDSLNFMRVIMGNLPDKELMNIWSSVYEPIVKEKGVEKTKVFDKIEEVLVELKNRGYVIVVYTNKTDNELEPFIDKFLRGLPYDYVIAVGGTEKAKPSPEPVYELLDKFGVEKENAYLVGDGETDVLTALNAGITPVAVLWGNRTKEQLSVVGAKLFAEQPLELLDIMK